MKKTRRPRLENTTQEKNKEGLLKQPIPVTTVEKTDK